MELFKTLYEKGLIYRDYRVVFWSMKDQRIIDDSELSNREAIKDVIVFKCDIKFFGGETTFIKEKFPNIKLLVFVQDPWKYVGIKVIKEIY
jgi:isoleucyl-tRNA synthetase